MQLPTYTGGQVGARNQGFVESAPRASAEHFGANRWGQVADMGRAFGAASDAAFATQRRFDQAKVRDLATEDHKAWMEYSTELKQTRQGLDADGIEKAGEEWWQKRRDERNSQFNTNYQRDLYAAHYAGMTRTSHADLTSYASQQSMRAERLGREAENEVLAQEVENATPLLSEFLLAKNRTLIRANTAANLQGQDGQTIHAAIMAADRDLFSRAVDARGFSAGPETALAYLDREDVKEALGTKKHAALKGKWGQAQERVEAERAKAEDAARTGRAASWGIEMAKSGLGELEMRELAFKELGDRDGAIAVREYTAYNKAKKEGEAVAAADRMDRANEIYAANGYDMEATARVCQAEGIPLTDGLRRQLLAYDPKRPVSESYFLDLMDMPTQQVIDEWFNGDDEKTMELRNRIGADNFKVLKNSIKAELDKKKLDPKDQDYLDEKGFAQNYIKSYVVSVANRLAFPDMPEYAGLSNADLRTRLENDLHRAYQLALEEERRANGDQPLSTEKKRDILDRLTWEAEGEGWRGKPRNLAITEGFAEQPVTIRPDSLPREDRERIPDGAKLQRRGDREFIVDYPADDLPAPVRDFVRARAGRQVMQGFTDRRFYVLDGDDIITWDEYGRERYEAGGRMRDAMWAAPASETPFRMNMKSIRPASTEPGNAGRMPIVSGLPYDPLQGGFGAPPTSF